MRIPVGIADPGRDRGSQFLDPEWYRGVRPRATVVGYVLGGWADVPGFGRSRRQARFNETDLLHRLRGGMCVGTV